jgi:hypothetical protein
MFVVKKSLNHAPHGVEAFSAVLHRMGRILSHEVHGCLCNGVHDRGNERSRSLAHGAVGATALQQFGDAPHHLVGRRSGLGRDFIGYAELRQRAPFLGVGNCPISPVPPDMKELFTDVRISGKTCHSGGRHLFFQFKVERVEEIFFRLEVGEERPVSNTGLLRDARGRRTQTLPNYDARCRLQYRASLLVTPGPRHEQII